MENVQLRISLLCWTDVPDVKVNAMIENLRSNILGSIPRNYVIWTLDEIKMNESSILKGILRRSEIDCAA